VPERLFLRWVNFYKFTVFRGYLPCLAVIKAGSPLCVAIPDPMSRGGVAIFLSNPRASRSIQSALTALRSNITPSESNLETCSGESVDDRAMPNSLNEDVARWQEKMY
jgi:hypothetical protein